MTKYKAHFLNSDMESAVALNVYRVFDVDKEEEEITLIAAQNFYSAALAWAEIAKPEKEVKVGIHRRDGVFKYAIIKREE